MCTEHGVLLSSIRPSIHLGSVVHSIVQSGWAVSGPIGFSHPPQVAAAGSDTSCHDCGAIRSEPSEINMDMTEYTLRTP